MIIENKGNYKIMIATEWHADPLGGPAEINSTISFMPGEKIDLKVLGANERI